MKRNKLIIAQLMAALAILYWSPSLSAADAAPDTSAPAQSTVAPAETQKQTSETTTENKPAETVKSQADQSQTTPSSPEVKEKKAATIDDIVKKKIEEKKASDAEKGKATRCLVNPLNVHVTGYFAPLVRMGERNGHFAVFTGAKGGIMLNDFVIGAGYSMFADYSPAIVNNHHHKILTQFGGLLLEYDFFRKYIVNFSVGTIIGAGTSGYIYKKELDDDDSDHDDEYNYEYRYKGTYYFYLEPEIVLYVNVARCCRLGVGASYRYTYGLEKYGLTDKTFDGFNGIIVCQFGWF